MVTPLDLILSKLSDLRYSPNFSIHEAEQALKKAQGQLREAQNQLRYKQEDLNEKLAIRKSMSQAVLTLGGTIDLVRTYWPDVTAHDLMLEIPQSKVEDSTNKGEIEL